MPLTTGTRLGPYEIVAAIGAGGMGEVFRARDTKLNRDVALKVLPDSFANDPDRLARFTREAQVLASLNHPNIAAIYGIEGHALVMELVEGEDLSAHIARGPIALPDALPIARQIADALEAAHEQGIIHRDLKPANVKVRTDGTVKVLDFGLAKAMDPTRPASSADAMNSPTLTARATQMGMILGTVAYMAPEQARGKAVDRRADIWAYGAVLFEMLTGTRAFPGDDITDTLAAVVRAEPHWSLLPNDLSPTLLVYLRRCLQKDPKQRIGDIRDVRFALDGALDAPAPTSKTPAASPTPRGRVAWSAFAAAMLVAAALAIPAVQHLRETPPPEARVDILTPATGDPTSFALSPDGRQIVFVASGGGVPHLWLRLLASTTAQPLAATEGAIYPFWSPDSRSVGFFADGKLKRLDVGGGAPQTLAPVNPGRGGTWNAEGVILYSASATSPLYRVPASGGQPVAVTTLGQQRGHRHPFFLPDGHHFLFFAQGAPETSAIFLGSLDAAETTRLVPANARGVYLSSGWLLWVRAGTLLAQRLDLARRALTGDPIPLAGPVATDNTGGSAVSASAAGLVAYRADQPEVRQLAWFDRTGKTLGVVGAPEANAAMGPEVSPDGRWLAVDRFVQTNRDVWLTDLVRGGLTRFTFDAASDGDPVWSPDGSRIAFHSQRQGNSWDIWVKPSSGAGKDERLLETPNNESPLDWSKDGRFLLYQQFDPQTGSDVWALPMTGPDRKPVVVANTPFGERHAQFSPDGRWVAYDTNESGRADVVVQPFPAPSGKWPLSTGGGTQPRWRADGKELYFIAPDGMLMAVTIATSGLAVEAGAPVALFPTRITNRTRPPDRAQYAVARDGRFLITETTEESTILSITFIQHWTPEAKK